jgi:hypothetical protein
MIGEVRERYEVYRWRNGAGTTFLLCYLKELSNRTFLRCLRLFGGNKLERINVIGGGKNKT